MKKLHSIIILVVLVVTQTSFCGDTLKVIYQKAIDAYESDDYEEAIVQFSKYLEVASSHDQGYYMRGNAYYKLKEIDNAVNDYAKAYELGFKDAVMFFKMAEYYRSTLKY